jgi:hypothetical protein
MTSAHIQYSTHSKHSDGIFLIFIVSRPSHRSASESDWIKSGFRSKKMATSKNRIAIKFIFILLIYGKFLY